jgi:hypothetical protein
MAQNGNRLVRQVQRTEHFCHRVFRALLLLLAYWILPNLITYLGKVGVETLVRFKWVFIAGAVFIGRPGGMDRLFAVPAGQENHRKPNRSGKAAPAVVPRPVPVDAAAAGLFRPAGGGRTRTMPAANQTHQETPAPAQPPTNANRNDPPQHRF